MRARGARSDAGYKSIILPLSLTLSLSLSLSLSDRPCFVVTDVFISLYLLAHPVSFVEIILWKMDHTELGPCLRDDERGRNVSACKMNFIGEGDFGTANAF